MKLYKSFKSRLSVRKFLSLSIAFLSVKSVSAADKVEHYVFFNRERDRITEKSFLETKQFTGAQLKYMWRELEPQKNKYDFSSIEKNLQTLQKHGKKLFIQVQDITFSAQFKGVPRYLTKDPLYKGGVMMQQALKDGKLETIGWVARRWDPNVQGRFHKLLRELGKAFDGRIAGINLPETAIDYGEDLKNMPKDFSPMKYRHAVMRNLEVMAESFKKSIAMQYANFMPGEWRPDNDKGHLSSVYEKAVEVGVAVGGPDLLPYRVGQMHHPYHFIPKVNQKIPVGIAVQWNNYKQINPKTKKRVTIPGLYNFGTQYLGADIIFWCTQEPFYSQKVIPYLKKK